MARPRIGSQPSRGVYVRNFQWRLDSTCRRLARPTLPRRDRRDEEEVDDKSLLRREQREAQEVQTPEIKWALNLMAARRNRNKTRAARTVARGKRPLPRLGQHVVFRNNGRARLRPESRGRVIGVAEHRDGRKPDWLVVEVRGRNQRVEAVPVTEIVRVE